jgi:DNA repair protein RecO (recombination protein O)
VGKNSEAITLRGMDYRDNDRILRLLTTDNGKISAIARGVRREKSALRAAVEPITLGIYHLNPGRNMFTVSQAEILNCFRNIKDSLESILAASFMIDLTDSFLEENLPDSETYNLLKNTLMLLENKGEKWKEITLYFEINMHKIHGVLPDVYKCISCGGSKSGGRVKIDVERGGVLCRACSKDFPRDESFPVQSLFIVEKASRLEARVFTDESFDESYLKSASRLIAHFTRHYSGRELKTRHALDLDVSGKKTKAKENRRP